MNMTGSVETQSLATPFNTYYLSSSDCAEPKDDQFYPLNKDSVWQIPIPDNQVTYVVLSTFNLEEPQDGSCINDFVSVYADDQTPVKFCSSLDLVEESIPAGPEQLTIRFQSNEANNLGGFSGAVWFACKKTKFHLHIPANDDVMSLLCWILILLLCHLYICLYNYSR